MALRGLLDSLAVFMEDSLKEMQLPVKQENKNDQTLYRSIKVYKQRMPNASDAETKVPYILLQITNGEDQTSGTTGKKKDTVNVRAIITTYNSDPSEGSLSIINIIDKLRFDLHRAGVVGERYELLDPFEFVIYPDDTMPYHLAELSTVWSLPRVERHIPGLQSW